MSVSLVRKDSGLSWVGRVPAHWDIKPTRRAMTIVSRPVGSAWSDTPLLSLTKRGVIVRDLSTGEGKFPSSFETYQVVKADELVFCLFDMDETPRTVGRSPMEGMVTGAYTCFSINREVALPQFLEWYYIAIDDAKRFRPLYTGLRKVIQKPRFLSAGIALPPLSEQAAIADYLAGETARIDLLVEKQNHLITRLLERRAASIEHLLIGAGVKRSTTVSRTLEPLLRPAVSGLGVVTAYRDGAVTLRSNRRSEGYTFSDTEHGYQEIRPGDLVFHALDGFAGAVGISDSHGNSTPVYHVCRTLGDDNPRYVAMLLRHLGVSGFLETQAPNVRQRSVDFRNWSTFGRVPLDLPSLEAQHASVERIDQQTQAIDAIVERVKRFILLAKERRSALIAAVVTGQIEVRRGSEGLEENAEQADRAAGVV